MLVENLSRLQARIEALVVTPSDDAAVWAWKEPRMSPKPWKMALLRHWGWVRCQRQSPWRSALLALERKVRVVKSRCEVLRMIPQQGPTDAPSRLPVVKAKFPVGMSGAALPAAAPPQPKRRVPQAPPPKRWRAEQH